MPLYARTEKRIKKKEREDELGITAVKDALREQGELEGSDDDEGDLSDESDSESDDEDGDEEGEEEDEGDDEGDEDGSEVDEGEEGSDEEEEDSDGDEDDEGRLSTSLLSCTRKTNDLAFPLTIEEVETNPIYPMDDHEGCVLCPGKTLKNEKMKETHLASSVSLPPQLSHLLDLPLLYFGSQSVALSILDADDMAQSHKRAMRRWTNRLSQADSRPLPSDDPRDVMNEILDDLEDHKLGQSASKTEEQAEGTEAAGTKRKRKDEVSKANKILRKAEEALKRVQAAGEEKQSGQEVKGLNRKARRLLAQREAEANGQPAGGKKLVGEGTHKVTKGGKDETSERKRKAGDKASDVKAKPKSSKPAKGSR